MYGFLEGTTTAVTSADWQPIIDNITSQISVSTVVGVVGSCVAAGIGLVFMWWGVRKTSGAIMSAFRKGKLSV